MNIFRRGTNTAIVERTEPPAPLDFAAMESELLLESQLQKERMREECLSIPSYVEHLPTVDDIGKISAASIIKEYEAAALQLEAMGADLIRCAQEAELMAAGVRQVIGFVHETAQRYRDEAKVIFYRIEEASALASQVKQTCQIMRDNLTGVRTSADHQG